jgi:hypothetical protein
MLTRLPAVATREHDDAHAYARRGHLGGPRCPRAYPPWPPGRTAMPTRLPAVATWEDRDAHASTRDGPRVRTAILTRVPFWVACEDRDAYALPATSRA